MDVNLGENYCFDSSGKYEKVVEIIQEFENSESYKNWYEDRDFPYTKGKKPELQPCVFSPREST